MNDILERYYTGDFISSTMISLIPCENPKIILDLGVGEASLIKAAFGKWGDAAFYGVDLDYKRIEHNRLSLPYCRFLHVDVLKTNFLQQLGVGNGKVDVAICNPPYSRFANENITNFDRLVKRSALTSIKRNNGLSTEILFLLYNLSVLKDGGHLGIILPDGIFTSHSFEDLRRDLVTNHELLNIIELPEKTFTRTEAKTNILILRKGKRNNVREGNTSLLKLTADGKLSTPVKINPIKLIHRMDYKFHSSTLYRHGKTLSDYNIEVFRGRNSSKVLREGDSVFFHTSDFKRFPTQELVLNVDTITQSTEIFAQKGDILMARVGKRIVGRWGIVTNGKCRVSDCVFIIRVPEPIRASFLMYLNSTSFINDLEIIKHGVCSELISKTDVLTLKCELVTEQ